ncbi:MULTISPECIES: carboxymuconolactone decarboxylase family protein [Amycolatopsis]|uniref:Carboxymuconolactone decarboxylase-like domain-containing protein n=1 Tax=Amycolatopsis albidoflavus TaxID=102226 RepID=A0ABW5IGV4_9PSEU
MRLSILDNGHRLRARLFLSITSKQPPDIVKMLLYRPGFLTRPLLDLTAPAMRGPSYWTAGEREFLAMSTALLHECPFCVDSHAELTRIAGHGEIDPLRPDAARPEVRTVRAFLETVTLHPDEIVLPDLPAAAIGEALRVNLVWNIVNRLANAFGFVLREGQLESGTRALHRFGYRFPGFLLADGPAGTHEDPVENMRYSVFTGPAVTDQALRGAAASGDGLPAPLQPFAAKVRDASYRLTDDDFAELATKYREDEVYEITVAAAVGAALRSFDAGQQKLDA